MQTVLVSCTILFTYQGEHWKMDLHFFRSTSAIKSDVEPDLVHKILKTSLNIKNHVPFYTQFCLSEILYDGVGPPVPIGSLIALVFCSLYIYILLFPCMAYPSTLKMEIAGSFRMFLSTELHGTSKNTTILNFTTVRTPHFICLNHVHKKVLCALFKLICG
jgi:hypothetical protein